MGIYSFLEDKWYSAVDWVDQFIPIGGLVDKIDEHFPSFLLFAALLLLLLIVLFFVLSGAANPLVRVDVVVLSSAGTPLAGVEVGAFQNCSGSVINSAITDGDGKAVLILCPAQADVSASKKNYLPASESFDFSVEKEASLSLRPVVISALASQITVKVLDEKSKILSNAKLNMICFKGQGSKTTEIGIAQPQSGFVFTLDSNCTSIKFEASASGYESGSALYKENEFVSTIKLTPSIRKGTASFTIDSPSGKINDAAITVTDTLIGKKQSVLSVGGSASLQLDEGSYTYVVIASGYSKTGSFEIKSGKIEDILVYFPELTSAEVTRITSPSSDNNVENVYLKLLDGNSVVAPAKATIYYTKGNDTNVWSTYDASTLGIIGPYPVIDINGRTFRAIIKASGYETKLVDIDLRTKTEGPQIVSMKQGGAKLKVKVIDDLNAPVKGVYTELRLSGFSATFDSALTTDANGETFYYNLPDGSYTVKASTTKDEGSASFTIAGSDKSVEIKLITGRGTIQFNLYGQNGKVDAFCEIYTLKNGVTEKILSSKSASGIIKTASLVTGTKIFLKINDANFIPYQSPLFEITRQAQTKTVYLVKESELPNSNEVQMFLVNVYDSDPILYAEKSTTSVAQGKHYYFLFNVVINNTNKAPGISNFFIAPAAVDSADRNVFLQNGQSIDGTGSVLSSVVGYPIIETSLGNTNLVSENGKQLNVRLNELQGKIVVPVIAELSVGEIAKGSFTLGWQAFFGDKNSLIYSKEIEIGKTICFKDCPIFLFSNYVKHNNGAWTAMGEDVYSLQMEEDYNMKVLAENLSDTDFGQTMLVLELDKTGAERLKINDANRASAMVTTSPLSLSAPSTFTLEPILAKSGSIKVNERMEKKVSGVDELKGKEGVSSMARFEVLSRKLLGIEFYATQTKNTLYEKTVYPFLYVKTTSRDPTGGSTKNVKANWSVKRLDTNDVIANGQTDKNGVQTTNLDLSNITAGTKVLFSAVDENNSVPAALTVEVTNIFGPSVSDQPAPMCIKVIYEGKEASQTETNLLPITVQAGKSITITSECADASNIQVYSDLYVSSKNFSLPAGGSISLGLDAKDTVQLRGGMLGVYPLQVLVMGTETYQQAALIDVFVLSDSASFELTNPIFDFRTKDTSASSIINKRFAGRMDNYYPQMEITTNSVNLVYKKPGNPAEVILSPIIKSTAIEAITYGFLWGKGVSQGETGGSCGGDVKKQAPLTEDDFFLKETLSDMCSEKVEAMEELVADPKEELDLNETNPTIPFYKLPEDTQQKVVSEIVSATGSSGSLSAAREETKISFAEGAATGDPSTPKGNPMSPREGDVYDIYPGQIGTEIPPMGCSMEHLLGWVAAPRPPGHEKCEWLGSGEKNIARATVVGAGGDCDDLSVDQYLLSDMAEQYVAAITTKAKEDEWYTALPVQIIVGIVTVGTIFLTDALDTYGACAIYLAHEHVRVITWQGEQASTWTKLSTIVPEEGRVNDLGRYEVTLKPKWTTQDEAFGHKEGEYWEGGTGCSDGGAGVGMILGCVKPHGFIPPEAASSEEGAYELPNYLSPLVEYSSGGLVANQILPESVPPGVRMFLKNGHVYAEYIGISEIPGNNIDFNITKVNLLGTEYAIITVRDWVSGVEKQTQTFQVKLIGNPHNCYSAEGIEGFTGKEFMPRLLFDWDWNAIPYNQCDSTNNAYTYCDGTQFTASMFGRLQKLDTELVKNNTKEVARLSNFYAYLIKDNYSRQFLLDFDEYYSNKLFTPTYFNTTATATGLDKFISENKIFFKVRQGSVITDATALPSAGLYNVEVWVDKDDEAIPGLFNQDKLNATITIVFNLYEQSKNYNPFYETPFDGEVGKKGSTYARAGYGTGVIGGEIKLNNSGVNALAYSNPMTQVNYSTTKSLSVLDSGTVMTYKDEGKVMSFNPSQPNPVYMSITSRVNSLIAEYVFSGFDASTTLNKKWRMKSSTIGSDCEDFSTNTPIYYTDQAIGGGLHRLAWPQVREQGTITLGTTFFTPRVSESGMDVRITPQDLNLVRFYTSQTVPSMTSASTIILKYYDDRGINYYDTIKGVFAMVADKRMCMSKNSQNEMRVWWNPDYLEDISSEVGITTGSNCG